MGASFYPFQPPPDFWSQLVAKVPAGFFFPLLPHGGKLKNTNELQVRNACFSSRALFHERVFQSKMPPPRCEQEIMRMTRHGDGGYFRGGEERTGGGILQGKQLSRGEEAALI